MPSRLAFSLLVTFFPHGASGRIIENILANSYHLRETLARRMSRLLFLCLLTQFRLHTNRRVLSVSGNMPRVALLIHTTLHVIYYARPLDFHRFSAFLWGPRQALALVRLVGRGGFETIIQVTE